MKITYLANQKQTDGSMRLSVISHDEWLQIVGLNRNLPAEQKRYFITDVIQDMGERDYLVIETSAKEYYAWNRERMVVARKRKRENQIQFLSLNSLVQDGNEKISVQDTIVFDPHIDEQVCDLLLLETLRKKLAEWKPWGCDLLDIYLSGNPKRCTKQIAEKYHVSLQCARKYKRQFEKFLKSFLESVSF